MSVNKLIAMALMGLGLISTAQASDQPVYDRVMKTQEIRCGYAEYPPFMMIDPNTKQPSGLFKDMWEQIGRKLDLKIKWETIVGWGEITAAINSGKVDAFCLAIWPDPGRSKNMLLSRAVFYSPIYLYGRADDKRFDGDYDILNNVQYTLTGMEGTALASVLETRFPKAKTAHIGPADPPSLVLMNVVSKKGDVTVVDASFVADFNKKNPGKIKRVAGPPVQVMQNVIPFAVGETQLKNMVDTVLTDFINDGTIASLLKNSHATESYAPSPDVMIGK
jgi:ABC-type amino acid transport substrate-binding protein